jgi:hypothetical protein
MQIFYLLLSRYRDIRTILKATNVEENIIMIYERLRVFVSSRMQELAPERAVIKAALNELNIDAWVFEDDAGARAQTIQQSYREEIESADLYIGLFWRGYGDYTVDEFDCRRF